MRSRFYLLLLMLLPVPALSQMRIIPHLTGPDGGFSSKVLVVHRGDEDAFYNLTPYTNGRTGAVVRGMMTPGSVLQEDAGVLFGGYPDYFMIEAPTSLQISVAYQANKAGSSPAHLLETNKVSDRWRFFAGDWNEIWDAMAVINMGPTAADVLITQYDAQGTEIKRKVLASKLGPQEKALYVISNKFTPTEGASFQVSSEQKLSVVALRGNLSSDFLWVNSSFPRDDRIPDEIAAYKVTFESTWSSDTHPVNFPANPHYSPLIGGTHDGRFVMWQEGMTASIGMEEMAENGSIRTLENNVKTAVANGLAEWVLVGPRMPRSPGEVEMTLSVSNRYPLVSLVTMLAPSPDWFVGVSGHNLFPGGEWVEEITIPLYPYDAGTDNGRTYNAPNDDTRPGDPIYRIPTEPFIIGRRVPPVGYFYFEREDQP